MSNFICYLDLLGIKELARYDKKGYNSAMFTFREQLFFHAAVFNNPENSINSHIYFFSDCAFIESDSLVTILNYLRSLRKQLNSSKNHFFTAAVTSGELKAVSFNGQKSIIKKDPNLYYLDDRANFLSGTIFNSDDVSKVFIIQNSFKGIGVFIDNSCLEKHREFIEEKYYKLIEEKYNTEKEEDYISVKEAKNITVEDRKLAKLKADQEFSDFIKRYISESFFFPSITTNTVQQYFDLKLDPTELHLANFNTIIEKFHNANLKSKKYGRFYFSHFANWIDSDDNLTNSNLINSNFSERSKKEYENSLVILSQLITEYNILVAELLSKAHFFDFLLFYLLNKMYLSSDQSDTAHFEVISRILKSPHINRFLTRIDEIPDCILSPIHKDRFIRDYFTIRNTSITKEKEKRMTNNLSKRLKNKE